MGSYPADTEPILREFKTFVSCVLPARLPFQLEK
jgi:hypothetical protein